MKRLRRWLRRAIRTVVVVGAVYATAGFLTSRIVPGPSALTLPEAGPVPQAGPLSDAAPGLRVWAWAADAAPASEWIADRGVEVRGAVSVHSGRSHDAEGTFQEIGRAASRAGLDFVILGDHPNVWLDEPGALDPVREGGVLLVPGQEMVIAGVGRVLTVGLEADSIIRRWEGEVADLAARVEAVDGYISVVHARSPRGRERWQAGIVAPGIDAWESLDISEIARLRLADRWAGYHIASFLFGLATGRAEGPVLRLNREGTGAPGLLAFDSARAGEPLTLTAGLNHHPKARIAGRLVPPYTPFFRTFTNHVLLPEPLPDDAAEARARLLAGLRSGRVFVSLGDAPEAAGFAFGALGGSAALGGAGASGAAASGTPDLLAVRLPPGASGGLLVRVLRNGRELAWIPADPGVVLAIRPPGPGVYRVEVARAGIPLGSWRYGLRPWILSNAVDVPAPLGG